jgi:hypothetical protein
MKVNKTDILPQLKNKYKNNSLQAFETLSLAGYTKHNIKTKTQIFLKKTSKMFVSKKKALFLYRFWFILVILLKGVEDLFSTPFCI